MKIKYIFGIILLIAIAGVGVGLKMFFKPHADISKSEVAFRLEEQALINE